MTAPEITAPAWSKLTDSVEHDEPISKSDIAMWLMGVCDNTMTMADHGKDFVAFVAKETGLEGDISVEALAEHLFTKYDVSHEEFHYVQSTCFADTTESHEGHGHEEISTEPLVEPTMEVMTGAVNDVVSKVDDLQM